MYRTAVKATGVMAMAILALSVVAGPLKTWDYSDHTSFKLIVSQGNDASFKVNPDVKTPDGLASGEFSIGKLKAKRVPWDIQLNYVYGGGLKAGQKYEIEFFCKGSASGPAKMIVALADSPWTPLSGAGTSFKVEQEWRTVRMAFTAKHDTANPLAAPRLMLADCGEDTKMFLGPVTLREHDPVLPFALNKGWTLFLNASAPDSFKQVPETLPGAREPVKGQPVELTDNALDLGKMAGISKLNLCAVLYNEFHSSEAGRMRLGLSADWWMAVHINGVKSYDSWPVGNGSHAFTPDDHVIDIPVKVGRNLLAVKVLSGSEGWRFVCGPTTHTPNEIGGVIFMAKASTAWKPVDANKVNVKPGTALDFSNLVGERRPAGAFGRVIANSNGKLAFEKSPDEQARLFGFNTTVFSSGQTWTKAAIKEFAESISRQGYNAIRLQFTDHNLVGGYKIKGGNFVEAFQKDVEFDKEELDKFDYLLSCFKTNGIYYNLDLMNGGNGYCKVQAWSKAGRKPGKEFNIQLLINPAYRRHWAMAVTMLMNHRNPYTGICLKDEPALFCAEPYNEQDILLYNSDRMKELTPSFREYLKTKYKTNEALRQAWKQPEISFKSVPDISEKVLRKSDAQANDAGHFLIKLMSDANDWYFKTLRAAGYQGLISQWDMIVRMMEMPVRAMMPVIAQHSYNSYPGGVPTKNLVKKSIFNIFCEGNNLKHDMFYRQGSTLNASYFRAAAAIRFLDRPFMMTEYSQSFCNRYRHEQGLFFGSYAALNGWDVMCCHSHSHGRAVVIPQSVSNIKNIPVTGFEDGRDPISRGTQAVIAFAWLRGDVSEAKHSVQMTLTDKAMFPKHFLSAIGDDYAKLSMLTKIGIACPEVTPLEPVAKITPDVEFTPVEFSPLRINSWYIAADNRDGTLFPSLLAKLRKQHVLPKENKTDYAKRVFQSETGEITLDGKAETMEVVTPRLEGAVIKRDKPVKLGNLEIESCSKPASVTVVALERNKTLAESKHLLLVFATNALNSGMTFENSSMQLMADVGHLPVLLETASLSLKLQSIQQGKWQIYPLYLDGTRMSAIPCQMENGRLALSVNTAQLPSGTVFFEIVSSAAQPIP